MLQDKSIREHISSLPFSKRRTVKLRHNPLLNHSRQRKRESWENFYERHFQEKPYINRLSKEVERVKGFYEGSTHCVREISQLGSTYCQSRSLFRPLETATLKKALSFTQFENSPAVERGTQHRFQSVESTKSGTKRTKGRTRSLYFSVKKESLEGKMGFSPRGPLK